MRRLDRVLGDAACSALATAHRLRKPFALARRPIRKIAVMKFFGMGSIIVASRSLAALRDAYPGAEIHFVTFAGNRGILDILAMTDRNHYVDPSTPQAFLRTTFEVAAALRRARCDLVLDLEFFAKFPLVLGSLAGIPKKAGFYLTLEGWRSELLDYAGQYNSYFHTSDIFLSLAYLCATGDYYYLQFNEWSAKYKYPRIEPSERSQMAATPSALIHSACTSTGLPMRLPAMTPRCGSIRISPKRISIGAMCCTNCGEWRKRSKAICARSAFGPIMPRRGPVRSSWPRICATGRRSTLLAGLPSSVSRRRRCPRST